jgi:adenylate cyclase
MSYDADEALPPQLILNALRRVIASPYFVNSERKRRFLEYIVQETLAGRADRIKEYTVAVDVFDRDPNFNPMTDPVVRIEAGRLRRCLEHYYLAEGAADRVWITIPKGGYVPRFVVTKGAASSIPKALGDIDRMATGQLVDINATKAAADQTLTMAVSPGLPLASSRSRLPPRARLWASILSLSVVLFIALLSGAFLLQVRLSGDGRTTARQGPGLIVLPFANNSGDPSDDVFANGTTEEVIGALVRLGNMDVFDVGFRDRTGPALPDGVLDGRVDYVLKGSVSRDGSHVEVNIELLRATDGQYLWSSRFHWELGAGNMVDLRHDIAMQIARVLAQSHVGK